MGETILGIKNRVQGYLWVVTLNKRIGSTQIRQPTLRISWILYFALSAGIKKIYGLITRDIRRPSLHLPDFQSRH